MWTSVQWLAGEAPANDSNALLALIGTLGVAALGSLGLVVSEYLKGRNSRTAPSPPAPVTAGPDDTDLELYQRTAVLKQRADDADKRANVQDRTARGQQDTLDEHGDRIAHLEQRINRVDPDGRPG